MVPKNNGAKPKRQKKNKSRTEVSDGSDSEMEIEKQSSPLPSKQDIEKKSAGQTKAASPSSSFSSAESSPEPSNTKRKTDAQIATLFTQFYLSQATREFAEDLDKLRSADDFRDEQLPLLIKALGQGTGMFGKEEMRRVVEGGESL